MKIKFIDLGEVNAPLVPTLMKEIKKVLISGDYILGEKVQEFEKKFAEYLGTRYAIGVNSGTDALILALRTLDIGRGDEVITAPNSFVASASAIALTGARPVLVDVNEDYTINPDLIEKKITKKTKAIMPVHLTGKPARMDRIVSIAKRYNLHIIEDAAQAIGAKYHNRAVGTFGIGCFSLHPLKNLSVCGDGGAVVSSDKKIMEKIKCLRNIGQKDRDHLECWSGNSRLDSLQAAIALVKLKQVEKVIALKRKIAALYNQGLKNWVLYVPEEQAGERQVYQNYIIQVRRRNQLQNYLAAKGIETKVHYPIPIHLQKPARALGYRKGDFPVTERLSRTMLTLPSSYFLRMKEVNYIIRNIQRFYC